MEAAPTFFKRFGDLVALLRTDPGNDAAQDLALATSAASAATVSMPGQAVSAGAARPNPHDLSPLQQMPSWPRLHASVSI